MVFRRSPTSRPEADEGTVRPIVDELLLAWAIVANSLSGLQP